MLVLELHSDNWEAFIPLKNLALLLTHVLCKHAISSLHKISLCLTEYTTLACNSKRSGNLARKGGQKKQQ